MKKYLIALIFLIVPSIAWPACTWVGNVGTSAGLTAADVLSCISDASSKTGAVTVILPPGSERWTSNVAINMSSGFTNVTSFSLIGAGTPPNIGAATTGGTSIDVTGILFSVTGVAGKKWRISNLSITGTPVGYAGQITFSGTSKPSNGGGFRIDHITFRNSTRNAFQCASVGTTGGVIDHVDKLSAAQASNWGEPAARGYGNTMWNSDPPAQEDRIYIESSILEDNDSYKNMVADNTDGAYIVFRYNTLREHHFGGHDASSVPRSGMYEELYNNHILTTYSSGASSFTLRGGSGMVFNNYIESTHATYYPFYACGSATSRGICLTNYRSGTLSSSWYNIYYTACDNTAEYMCVGNTYWSGTQCNPASASACNNVQSDCQAVDTNSDATGWPCRDQIGRGKNQTLVPMYFWGNTTKVTQGGSIVYNGTSTVLVSSNSTHIKANRDFYDYDASFNGTSGVGTGTKAALEGAAYYTSCTNGVGYFATDEQKLYTCASNSWSEHYARYTCPHPLADPLAEGSCDPTVAGTDGYVLTGGASDVTAPTFVSASLNATALTVNLSEDLTATDYTGLDLACSGAGTEELSDCTESGGVISCTIDRSILQSETCTIAFTTAANAIEDVAGNDLDSFTAQSVQNLTPAEAPTKKLTITKTGSGCTITSSPSGISCGSTCEFDFTTATQVTLGGYLDNGWASITYSGGCSGGTADMTNDVANCTVTCTPIYLLN